MEEEATLKIQQMVGGVVVASTGAVKGEAAMVAAEVAPMMQAKPERSH